MALIDGLQYYSKNVTEFVLELLIVEVLRMGMAKFDTTEVTFTHVRE